MSNRVTRSSKLNESDSPTTTKKSNVLQKRSQRKKVDGLDCDAQRFNGESNAEDVHVTPPKQRKSSGRTNTLSPSTFLHRLSLSEKDDQGESQPQANNGPKSKSKIDSARKVLNAAETDELYGREKEFAEINEFLSSNKKTSASIYISGQPGIFP